jgi:hypothetical protein
MARAMLGPLLDLVLPTLHATWAVLRHRLQLWLVAMHMARARVLPRFRPVVLAMQATRLCIKIGVGRIKVLLVTRRMIPMPIAGSGFIVIIKRIRDEA